MREVYQYCVVFSGLLTADFGSSQGIDSDKQKGVRFTDSGAVIRPANGQFYVIS